jgi:hypothetical protein
VLMFMPGISGMDCWAGDVRAKKNEAKSAIARGERRGIVVPFPGRWLASTELSR